MRSFSVPTVRLMIQAGPRSRAGGDGLRLPVFRLRDSLSRRDLDDERSPDRYLLVSSLSFSPCRVQVFDAAARHFSLLGLSLFF